MTKSDTTFCHFSERAMTPRRQTPLMLRILSPPKVRAVGFLRFLHTRLPVVSPLPLFLLLVAQRSSYIWMNQTLSQPAAITTESQSASSPLGLPAAESPLTNRHCMNRRRRLRTKDAGAVKRGVSRCYFHEPLVESDGRICLLFQVHSD